LIPSAALTGTLELCLSDARLRQTPLPGTDIKLWLIDPENMRRVFTSDETRRILDEPPYWAFCWASGLALSQWLFARPERVANRRVLDFGTGSGVAAITAAHLGAREVVACDLDQAALEATRQNALLNNVKVRCIQDIFSLGEQFDLLIAADVLYDRANLPLLDRFTELAGDVLVADSRIRDFDHALYRRVARLRSDTLPDLAESDEFRIVSVYQSRTAYQ
jgi:predicted nicotinamide N-methyase